jgi:hypothetical protein
MAMTSMDSYEDDAPDARGTHESQGAPVGRRVPIELGPDPVHPDVSNLSPAPHEEIAPTPPTATATTTATATGSDDRPTASDLGVPAVFEHQVVALEVGSAASPVAVHSWTGEQVGTLLLTPTQAQVWARAGRLTLATAEGVELPFTVLAPEESATTKLGAHWPLGEPDGRVRRIATAAAHDVGDLLTFPAWLSRTAHVSGERNNQLARLVNRIRAASPSTAIYYGQTFGHLHARPDQHHPYDHKGLVGHEGWPGEL